MRLKCLLIMYLTTLNKSGFINTFFLLLNHLFKIINKQGILVTICLLFFEIHAIVSIILFYY
jgi:hypothetical protein